MPEITALLLLGLALLCFRLFKVGDLFAPWVLTATVWFVILLGVTIYRDELYPLTPQFYTCLALWMPIFCASSLLTYYLLPARPQSGSNGKDIRAALGCPMEINRIIFDALFIISCVITPLYIYEIMKIVSMFDPADILSNLRLLAVHGDEDYGFLAYSAVINKVLLIVAIWHYPRVPLWKLLIIYATNFLSFAAIMEKGSLFFIVFATLFVLYEKGTIRPRSILITLVLLVIIFWVINIARTFKSQSSSNADDYSFLEFILIYILSPPVAFCQTVEDIGSLAPGEHTFRTVYVFLQRFGADVTVQPIVQNFVLVPVPTNVYTIFQPFFQDFGYLGVAFFALVYGFFSGALYRGFVNGHGLSRCFYTWVVYCLVLQFYQEYLFIGLVGVIQMLFFLLLILSQRLRFASLTPSWRGQSEGG